MTVEAPKVNASVDAAARDTKKKELKKDLKKEELSEEDVKMKEEIDAAVQVLLHGNNVSQYSASLTSLKSLIQTATSSMTSVPRPLKFLRPHFRDLQRVHASWISLHPTPKNTCLLANIDAKSMESIVPVDVNPQVAEHLADILSVIGMTFDDEHEHHTLRYCVQGTDGNLSLWGHEYLRHLCSEMLNMATLSDDSTAAATAAVLPNGSTNTTGDAMALEEESIYFGELELLAERLLPQLCHYHAYMDAVDLAVFFELNQIVECITDAETSRKMAAYLCACAQQLLGDELHVACDMACQLYLNANDLVSAFGVYLTFDQPRILYCIWNAAFSHIMGRSSSSHDNNTADAEQDPRVRKHIEKHGPLDKCVLYQMAFEMARKSSGPAPFLLQQQKNADGDWMKSLQDANLKRILQNADLSRHFLSFAKELEILEPKHPDDIYKSHLEHIPKYASASNLSDSKHALASAFVSAFLNAGFLTDKLINDEFIYKHRDMALVSVCASAGLVRRWDMDALADLDRYIASDDVYIRAGGLLGVGLISCGLQSDYDAALYLLTPFLEHTKQSTDQQSQQQPPPPPPPQQQSLPASLNDRNLEEETARNINTTPTTTTMSSSSSYSSDAQLLMSVSAMALSLAYMGTCRQDIFDKLAELLADSAAITMETKATLTLAVGMIFNGYCRFSLCAPGDSNKMTSADAAVKGGSSGNSEATSVILEALHGLTEEEATSSPYAKWMVLGLSLTILGQGEAGFTPVIQEALRALPGGLSEISLLTANACAFAASGDVEEVRMMVEKIMECEKQGKRDVATDDGTSTSTSMSLPDVVSSYAIMAMAMIAMRDDVGREMVMRLYRHLMHEGDRGARRAIPLGIGLLYVSHPTNTGILDLLSKYTHDGDKHVAQHAIFALGLAGAGTNNARIGQMLRQLVAFYHKDASLLFVLRLAQGLIHLGKGMLTLSPYHSTDRMNWSALSGLLIVMFGMLDSPHFLAKHHIMIYYLVAAMYPRLFMTLDESLNPIPISVRVGQVVDTVGQAGQRKTITGWQTHLSPVLINVGERAEMATEEYWPQSNVLEGFIICKKNPNYIPSDK